MNNIIDRYVYAVVSRLPQDKRQDIEQELRSILQDMMDERGGESEENAKAAVEELGNPAKLAEKYLDRPRYLISPRIYDTYVLVLKIVLLAVAVGIVVSAIVGAATLPEASLSAQSIGGAVGTFIADLFGGLITGFAWVTIVFWLVERFQLKVEMGWEKEWSVKDLSEIPTSQAVISRGESIANIVFSTILILVVALIPYVLAAYISYDGSIEVITVFDISVLQQRMPLLFVAYALGILREAAKLITGRWSVQLGALSAVVSALCMGLMLGVFADQAVWNPQFAPQIAGLTGAGVFVDIWNVITYAIVWIIFITGVVKAISELVKGIRYGKGCRGAVT